MNSSKRVQSNLLQQNCYVRDSVRVTDLKTDCYTDKSYLSVDENVTESGYEVKKSVYPYPITPDYVRSFADSSNYKNDPLNAISNGVSRKNIGDCVEFQRIMNMDSSVQKDLYNQLKAKFSKSDSSVAPSKNADGGDNNA